MPEQQPDRTLDLCLAHGRAAFERVMAFPPSAAGASDRRSHGTAPSSTGRWR
jgi:hypothetical protein